MHFLGTIVVDVISTIQLWSSNEIPDCLKIEQTTKQYTASLFFLNAEQDLVIVRVSQLLDPTENGTMRLTNRNMASGEMVQEKDKIKRLN